MRKELALRLEKWGIWLAFIGVLVLLRHLFPVIFLTFVLTYIGNTLVKHMTRRFPRRRLNVCVVLLLFLAIVTAVGGLVVPKMFAEARQLAVYYIARDAQQAATPQRYVDSVLQQVLGAEAFRSFAQSETYETLVTRVEEWVRGFVPRVITRVREFVNESIGILFQFLLSIILTFLILWDLPKLKAGVKSLARGRTAEIYGEIAPGMTAFGVMLGRAFEAQTGIAMVNAILTAIGFLILRIPSIALLTTIVFFCSYIPVVGVMLSTVPAALFAFKAGGIGLVIWLVVMVLVVHAIEAYLLNPIIYGHHMKMHPVAILVILLVGEHVFGIWGLVLAVPMAAFVWSYLIGQPLTTAQAAQEPASSDQTPL